jgi:hypothetical protein
MDVRQNMKNPQTGEFEMLTNLEWKRLKVGMNKNANVDEFTCAVLGGPAVVALWFFQDVAWAKGSKSPQARLDYIMKLYEAWWPKQPTGIQLKGWIPFVKDHYNLEKECKLREDVAHTIAKLGSVMNDVTVTKKKLHERIQADFGRSPRKRVSTL